MEVDKTMSALTHKFADLLTLVYHKARNIRHLVRSGVIEDVARYSRIINLPVNSGDAWANMQGLRQRAAESLSIRKASGMFYERFRLSLEDLVVLYRNPAWQNSATGGNKWSFISEKVIELQDAIESRNVDDAIILIEVIFDLSHNTGRVRDKLVRLDRQLVEKYA